MGLGAKSCCYRKCWEGESLSSFASETTMNEDVSPIKINDFPLSCLCSGGKLENKPLSTQQPPPFPESRFFLPGPGPVLPQGVAGHRLCDPLRLMRFFLANRCRTTSSWLLALAPKKGTTLG